MKVIQEKILDQLIDDAQSAQRLRKNLNIHTQLDDPIQRLCNALEPGTYVRPHRHPQPGRWELFVILKGQAKVILFDEQGRVTETESLSSQGPGYIVEIPPHTWHTLISRQSGTVLFEIKQGPYQALTDKDFAAWAPAENTSAAVELLEWFRQCSAGQRVPELV